MVILCWVLLAFFVFYPINLFLNSTLNFSLYRNFRVMDQKGTTSISHTVNTSNATEQGEEPTTVPPSLCVSPGLRSSGEGQ